MFLRAKPEMDDYSQRFDKKWSMWSPLAFGSASYNNSFVLLQVPVLMKEMYRHARFERLHAMNILRSDKK